METYSTFETDQPWVVYTYGLTHDKWWPFWSSTRVLGYFRIAVQCAICGDRSVLKIKIPRFGHIEDKGKHPQRIRYLLEHVHPDQGHPMSWAMPLLNIEAHAGGVDLELLAMRLQADLNRED